MNNNNLVERKIKVKLEEKFDVSKLNSYTINGRIGELKIFGKKLTEEQAKEIYEIKASYMDYFWKTCKETHYIGEEKLIDY